MERRELFGVVSIELAPAAAAPGLFDAPTGVDCAVGLAYNPPLIRPPLDRSNDKSLA